MSLISDVATAVKLSAGKDSAQAVKMYSDSAFVVYVNRLKRMVAAELVKRENPLIQRIASVELTTTTVANLPTDFYALVDDRSVWMSGDAESPLKYADRRRMAVEDGSATSPDYYSVSWPSTGSYATLNVAPKPTASTAVQVLYFSIPSDATTTSDRLPFGETFTELFVVGSQLLAANAAEAQPGFEEKLFSVVGEAVDNAAMANDPSPPTVNDRFGSKWMES